MCEAGQDQDFYRAHPRWPKGKKNRTAIIAVLFFVQLL